MIYSLTQFSLQSLDMVRNLLRAARFQPVFALLFYYYENHVNGYVAK